MSKDQILSLSRSFLFPFKWLKQFLKMCIIYHGLGVDHEAGQLVLFGTGIFKNKMIF